MSLEPGVVFMVPREKENRRVWGMLVGTRRGAKMSEEVRIGTSPREPPWEMGKKKVKRESDRKDPDPRFGFEILEAKSATFHHRSITHSRTRGLRIEKPARSAPTLVLSPFEKKN